jgi:putative FmdB family regulatory protein
MPLYEYRCQRCEDVFEVIQRFSDEPLTVHENCGGSVERLISAAALQFKGTGWYITDYARAGNGSGAKEGTKEGGDSKTGGKETKENGSTSGVKSESKPETKSVSKAAPASAPSPDKK